jgi:hypothetical protein
MNKDTQVKLIGMTILAVAAFGFVSVCIAITRFIFLV